jgi:hypothetical protein
MATAVLVMGCSGPGPVASPTPQPPREFVVTIVDRTSQAPVPNAPLRVGDVTATTAVDGTATMSATPARAPCRTMGG